MKKVSLEVRQNGVIFDIYIRGACEDIQLVCNEIDKIFQSSSKDIKENLINYHPWFGNNNIKGRTFCAVSSFGTLLSNQIIKQFG